jgi:hypothetical protein
MTRMGKVGDTQAVTKYNMLTWRKGIKTPDMAASFMNSILTPI